MANVIFTLTDSDIRNGIIYALEDLESDEVVIIPASERDEFIQECVDDILQKFELYPDKCPYNLDYSETVCDLADFYGY